MKVRYFRKEIGLQTRKKHAKEKILSDT